MSRNPDLQSSADSPSPLADEQYALSIHSRVANAIFMLDATIGVGNIIVILLVLCGIGWLLSLMLPRMVTPPFSEADRAALQRQTQWPVYIEESFDDNQIHAAANWGLGYEGYDKYDVYRELVDDQYFWWVDFWTTDCCLESTWLITRRPLEDFILSADFEKHEGGDGPSYGVIFHYQDNENYYAVTFNDIGHLSLEIFHQGEWEVIFTDIWPYKTIRPFERNRLVLSVENGHGLILVNDQYIGQFDDVRIPRGYLGFVVESPYKRADTVAVSMDNITLRIPD